MKLDYDCVRNLMLTIESLGYRECINIDNLTQYPLLKDYAQEQIYYTLERIVEAGFVPNKYLFEATDGIGGAIYELTWQGHQYLDTIRDDGIWRKVKDKVQPLKSVPFQELLRLALHAMQSANP